MPANKVGLAARVKGDVSIPKEGPRAKAVGAKEIGKGKDLGRGTTNPVK